MLQTSKFLSGKADQKKYVTHVEFSNICCAHSIHLIVNKGLSDANLAIIEKIR